MIFNVIATSKAKIVAEYLYELEETAILFAERMKEKGYMVTIEKIFHHD